MYHIPNPIPHPNHITPHSFAWDCQCFICFPVVFFKRSKESLTPGQNVSTVGFVVTFLTKFPIFGLESPTVDPPTADPHFFPFSLLLAELSTRLHLRLTNFFYNPKYVSPLSKNVDKTKNHVFLSSHTHVFMYPAQKQEKLGAGSRN